jgi:diadenosine tetraphosphate (Ap4A) HIT family hydrolase
VQYNYSEVYEWFIFKKRDGFEMSVPSCIFCKIIQGVVPSKIIKEDEYVMVISDIHPKAPIHYLIIPKKHFIDITELTDTDMHYGWHILKIARDLAKEQNLQAFNLIANNGKGSGQSVFHLHFHLLSGKNIYSDGFSL